MITIEDMKPSEDELKEAYETIRRYCGDIECCNCKLDGVCDELPCRWPEFEWINPYQE